MAEHSWYRRRTWTSDDQAAFFARLRRSRGGFHKAQYCRIQASELQQAHNYEAALGLLDLLMAEWPGDAQTAAVYYQKAECHEKLGDAEAAIAAYRLVFQAQREQVGYRTSADLSFGWLVALTPYPALYDEALSALDEFASSSTFPYELFKAAVVRALIADARGDRQRAARYATSALAEAARTHSGYARHATLGLVANVASELVERLKRIAEHVPPA